MADHPFAKLRTGRAWHAATSTGPSQGRPFFLLKDGPPACDWDVSSDENSTGAAHKPAAEQYREDGFRFVDSSFREEPPPDDKK
jgi:hypothetical protein